MIIIVYDSERLTENCKEYVKSVVGSRRVTFKPVFSSLFLPKKYDYIVCLSDVVRGEDIRCSVYKKLKSGFSRFIDEQIMKD